MPLSYESERLYFSMMTENDGDLMLDLDSDPEVMRYITNGRTTTADEMRDLYIPRMLSYTERDRGWGLWKTCKKENDEFIGWFLLRPVKDHPQEVEIGWRFKRKFWGKGYGTEGARLFRDHTFRQDGVTRLMAIAMTGNAGSRKIMEKIGMSYITTKLYDEPPFFSGEVVLYQLDAPDSRAKGR